MAKLLKLRRGTTTQHASFTGAEGELTVDITKDTAVVHDGAQAGGRPLAREDMSNVSSASIAGRLGTDSIATTKIAAGALPTDVTVASINIVDGSIVNSDLNAGANITSGKLAPTGVSAGSYGSSSAIPIVTVNAQGQVTAASTTAIDSTTIANGSSSVSVANNGAITSNANHDFSAGIDVTGSSTLDGTVTINADSTTPALSLQGTGPNFIRFGDQAGQTAGMDLCFRTTPNTIGFRTTDTETSHFLVNYNGQVTVVNNLNVGAGVDVTGNITVTGTVDGVDVAALKTAKDSLSTTNGVILNTVTASSTHPQSENSNKFATTAYVRTAISEAQAFPSGTKMIFQQTSAPTGWTKVTSSVDNKALRVVSGTAGSGGSNAFSNTLASRGITANAGNTTAGGNVSSSAGNTTAGGNVSVSNAAQGGNVSIANTTAGGNVSISSVSTSGSVNSHTLSTNEMPSHSHSYKFTTTRNQWRSSGEGLQTTYANYQNQYRYGTNTGGSTTDTGGNGGHSHGFSGSSHNHNGSLSGSAHNHNATFTGSNHSHSGGFTGNAHNHNVTSSFTGSAHNHSISVGNLDMAVQYLDVIIAEKDY